MRMQLYPKVFLLVITWTFLFTSALLALENELAERVHILYTTNLSGALEDCRCGGEVVGGMTRVLRLLSEFQRQHPHVLILDGGDFLNSYAFPEANEAMLEVMQIAPYQAINLGDQEFVESEGFVFKPRLAHSEGLPLLNANLKKDRNTFLLSEGFRIFKVGNLTIGVTGLISPETFDFIHLRTYSVIPTGERLQQIQATFQGSSDVQLVLFHGPWQRAEELIARFPWIDIVILAHERKQLFRKLGKTIVCEAGSVGEYVGHLTLSKDRKSLSIDHEFIPVTRELEVDEVARAIVEQFYSSLKK